MVPSELCVRVCVVGELISFRAMWCVSSREMEQAGDGSHSLISRSIVVVRRAHWGCQGAMDGVYVGCSQQQAASNLNFRKEALLPLAAAAHSLAPPRPICECDVGSTHTVERC